MKIYYKAREIDYEKTLGSLEKEEFIIIPTSSNDIANIRGQVSKTSKRESLAGMIFTVNKSINGAIIKRIQ